MEHRLTLEKENLRMLTGVRGAAALWVVFAHLIFREAYNAGFAAAEGWGWLAYVARFDFLGVDFFFVLSGCLLYLQYRDTFERKTRSWDIDRFYLLRLARIYPMHLVGVGLIGLYHLLQIPHPIYSGNGELVFIHWKFTLLLNLTLMQSWGIFPVASWNEPAWTVSAMAFVYILFPNLVPLLKRLPTRAAPILISLALLLIGYDLLRRALPELSHTDGTGALLRGLVFFLTGCLSAKLYLSDWGKDWRWEKALVAIPALGALACVAWWKLYPFPVTLFHLTYPFFLLALLRARGKWTGMLANPVIIWFGGMSYSLYILHYPLLLFIKYQIGGWLAWHAVGNPFSDIWLYALVILMLGVASSLARRLIERPVHRWAQRRLHPPALASPA